MKEELEPCPFCGGTVSIAAMGERVFKWFSITRGNDDAKCTCRLFMESEHFSCETDGENEKVKLIRQWNNRVAAEYNNGWIPVSERMPEEHDTFSNEFDPITMAVIDTKWYTQSDLVAVTVYDSEHDKYFVCDDCTINGKWCNHADGFETVAWQPLPEVYRGGSG